MRLVLLVVASFLALAACARSAPPPAIPTVQRVYPATFPSGEPQTLLIKGAGFEPGAQVFVGGVQTQGATWVNETLLAVRIPVGLSQGRYEVLVRNPNGLSGSKGEAVVVTPAPAQPVVTRPQPLLPLLPSLRAPAWDEVLDALRKQAAGQGRRLRPKEADKLERQIAEIERQIREGRYYEAAQYLRDLLARLDALPY